MVVQACEQQITHGEAYTALIDQVKRTRRHCRLQNQLPMHAEQRASLDRALEHFYVAADGVREFLTEPKLSEVMRCDVKGARQLFKQLQALDDGKDALVPLEMLQLANSLPRNRLNLDLYIEELGSERALDPAKILEVVNANLGSVIRPIRIPGDVDAGKAGKEADQSGAAAKSDADETMALDGPDGEGDEEEAEDEESFVLDGRGGGPAGDAIDQPELDEAVERDES